MQMGAYPVFVLDGDPSPLKSRARIDRFCRANGISLPTNLDQSVAPVKRNATFTKWVAECVVRQLLKAFLSLFFYRPYLKTVIIRHKSFFRHSHFFTLGSYFLFVDNFIHKLKWFKIHDFFTKVKNLFVHV